MEDKDYQKSLKTYSLDTLLDITAHIDRETYPHRYQWVQSEIDNREKGIPAELGAATPQFTFGTDEIYAGFWYRLAATLIDTLLVFVPLSFWFNWCFLLPSPYSLLLLIPLPLIFPVYNIACMTYYGQTLGKKAVGIQVIRCNGAHLSFRQAAIRHCVDAVLGIMMLATLLIGLFLYSSAGTSQTSEINSFQRQLPSWDLLDDLWDVWIWSEVVVLLFNQHKQGLHDFLAGTFVIHQQKALEFQARIPEEVSDWSIAGWQQRLLSIFALFEEKVRKHQPTR